jgi:hypothetical protein
MDFLASSSVILLIAASPGTAAAQNPSSSVSASMVIHMMRVLSSSDQMLDWMMLWQSFVKLSLLIFPSSKRIPACEWNERRSVRPLFLVEAGTLILSGFRSFLRTTLPLPAARVNNYFCAPSQIIPTM